MYKPELDRLPAREVEREWERKFIVGREKLDHVLDIYRELGFDLENDIYLRTPQGEEIDQKCVGCVKLSDLAESCVVVYVRRRKRYANVR